MASVVIDTIIGVVYTVIVAFIFFMLGLRASRPNLIRGGSSTESVRIPNKDVMVTSVTIQNNPSLLGMKIDREPARIVSAQIYHPSLTRIFGPNLVWQKEMSREPSAPGAECIIEEGKSRSLYLFGKERFSEEYFIYAPTDNSADLPDRLTKFKDEERKFSLVLRDHIGREYRFDFTARNDEQSVKTIYKLTWRTRRQSIVEAYWALRRAFSLR